jgi:hypothetical protein
MGGAKSLVVKWKNPISDIEGIPAKVLYHKE